MGLKNLLNKAGHFFGHDVPKALKKGARGAGAAAKSIGKELKSDVAATANYAKDLYLETLDRAVIVEKDITKNVSGIVQTAGNTITSVADTAGSTVLGVADDVKGVADDFFSGAGIVIVLAIAGVAGLVLLRSRG